MKKGREEKLIAALGKAYREQRTEGPDSGFSARVMSRVRMEKARQAAVAREEEAAPFGFRLLPVAAGASFGALATACFVLAAVSWWPESMARWLMPDGIGLIILQSGIF